MVAMRDLGAAFQHLCKILNGPILHPVGLAGIAGEPLFFPSVVALPDCQMACKVCKAYIKQPYADFQQDLCAFGSSPSLRLSPG